MFCQSYGGTEIRRADEVRRKAFLTYQISISYSELSKEHQGDETLKLLFQQIIVNDLWNGSSGYSIQNLIIAAEKMVTSLQLFCW